MKTFRDFILECELVEGKVEWDNPKRPLQSGMTPREKNRVQRKRLEVFKGLGSTRGRSFTSNGPSERDYERYGSLTLANKEQSGLKTPKERLHKFKDARGKSNRKKYAPHVFRNLKEPKESFDYNIDEGRIPWDDENRPLRSGWTPREKNRAKRISTGVENPEHSPTEKQLERYGKLQSAHDTQKNVKVKPKDRHKNPEDYSLGRRNAFFKSNPTLPSEHQKGDSSGLRKMPRNVSKGEDVFTRKYGSKNDEKRDEYYKKGPKGLKEPKESFDYNIDEGIQPLPTQKILRKIKQKSKVAQDAMNFRRENQSSHTGDSLERLKAFTKRKIAKKASQIKKMKTAMRTHDPIVGQFKELENKVKGRK